ncbi:hypothetical protein NM045_2233 [Neisseria meningitidis NM045]|nr:hypothetical protein NM045_2233 [Neisseria meningitidis NM045]
MADGDGHHRIGTVAVKRVGMAGRKPVRHKGIIGRHKVETAVRITHPAFKQPVQNVLILILHHVLVLFHPFAGHFENIVPPPLFQVDQQYAGIEIIFAVRHTDFLFVAFLPFDKQINARAKPVIAQIGIP